MLDGLPPELRDDLATALRGLPSGAATLVDARPVGGGCISATSRLQTSGGPFFLKWSPAGEAPPGLFREEARSLRILGAALPGDAGAGTGSSAGRATGHVAGIRVPRVVDLRDEARSAPTWLLLEWLEPGVADTRTWEVLGRGLAELHRNRRPSSGWDADNFIGTLPQQNGWIETWPTFWGSRRLEPQLRRALDAGLLDAAAAARVGGLLDDLEDLLGEAAAADGASLLHGDFWGGNVHPLGDGTPAIVDPASYHGHREVDLAMAELFGGFGPGFRRAYEESWPLRPGYAPRRRAAYQLYYLLVHVNLFGAGYRVRTLDALSDAGY